MDYLGNRNYGTYPAYNAPSNPVQNPLYTPVYTPTVQPPVQPQMVTNKLFVTSLEDALGRYANPNTVMVYRHQDEKYEYEITTDAQGKKSYRTIALSDYSTVGEATPPSPSPDLKDLEARISALEKLVNKSETEA